MIYGIYQSAAGMQVNEYRQAVVTNNLANVDTVGFKQDLAVVRERMVASRGQLGDRSATDPTLERMTGGSLVSPTHTQFDAGTIKETGNRRDVAIDGDGFFVVQVGDETRYTRDGRFAVNASGELVTVAGGHRVLDEAGMPIVAPAEFKTRVAIEANGEVRAGNQVVGRLGLVNFDEASVLRKTGGNLFQAFGGEPRTVQTDLRVQAVEASNVNATRQMVTMLEVARAYEMNATLVGLADSTLGRAVNDIARLS